MKLKGKKRFLSFWVFSFCLNVCPIVFLFFLFFFFSPHSLLFMCAPLLAFLVLGESLGGTLSRKVME